MIEAELCVWKEETKTGAFLYWDWRLNLTNGLYVGRYHCYTDLGTAKAARRAGKRAARRLGLSICDEVIEGKA